MDRFHGILKSLCMGLIVVIASSAIGHSKTQCLLSKFEFTQDLQDQQQEQKHQAICNNVIHLKDLKYIVQQNWKYLKIVNEPGQQFYMDDLDDGQFPNLEKFDISEAGELLLNESGFQSLPNLLALNISMCQIESLKGIHFGVLNKLEYLDASWNQLEELSFDLKSNLLNLEGANFTHNSIKFIANDTKVVFPKLKYLHLDNNDVASANFHDYTMLQVLSLGDNQIEKLTENSFRFLESMEKLIITGNPLYYIGGHTFESMTKLKILNLSANSLETLDSDVFIGLTRLLDLDLSSNDLKELSEGQFQHVKKLQYLDISRNSLTTLNSTSFSNLSNLRKLYVYENDITEVKSNTFANLIALDTLDLSHNALEYLDEDVFGSNTLERFKKLILKSNNIKSFHPLAFTSLPFIQYLSLGYNELTSLDVRTFAPMRRLEKLHLGTNLLETIPEKVFESLTDVTELLIDNNHLTFLPHSNTTFNRLRKASLEGNPWQCPCLDEIVDWFEKRNIEYVRPHSPYYSGKKPLCVVTPVKFCVRDINLVRQYPVEDIYNSGAES